MNDVHFVRTRDLLQDWRDGEDHGWRREFAWLARHDLPAVIRLAVSVLRDGIREPVLLGGDGRVWDGHHRIFVAWLLRLRTIPCVYAMEARCG